MTKIQTRKRTRGISYRVELMKNGKRISRSFNKKLDAERFVAHATLDDDVIHKLVDTTLSTLLLKQAIQEYLSQLSGRDYTVLPRLLFWNELLGDLCIGKVTKQSIKVGLKLLNERGLAPATLNRYKSNLSSVFEYLKDEYDISCNPCREVKQRPENNKRVRFLSETERKNLLETTRNSRWERLYLLVLMAITTGARRGEMLGLRWVDIDFTQREGHIARSKNGEPKTLSFTDEVAKELSRFRQLGHEFVFPHPDSSQMPFKNFDCYWRDAKKQAQITNLRFHDLRHTCASILAMNGASLLEIAHVLGHKSITMTQRYSHLCNEHKAKLIDRVMGSLK